MITVGCEINLYTTQTRCNMINFLVVPFLRSLILALQWYQISLKPAQCSHLTLVINAKIVIGLALSIPQF